MTCLGSVNFSSYWSTVRPSSVPLNLPNSASTEMNFFALAISEMDLVKLTFSEKGRWDPSTIMESKP